MEQKSKVGGRKLLEEDEKYLVKLNKLYEELKKKDKEENDKLNKHRSDS